MKNFTKNWRNVILSEFATNVSNLTLVSDPDYLVTEEILIAELYNRGFELIEFENSVEFRYIHETYFRSKLDSGEKINLIVVVNSQNFSIGSLPFDLLHTGRNLSINLGKLFPKMSYPVVKELDCRLLDKLFDSQSKYSITSTMGDDETKDFIIKFVFGISTELISSDVDFLRMLFRIHYGKIVIPKFFAERITYILNIYNQFSNWPIEELIIDRELFFSYIQERWPIFLEKLNQHTQNENSDFNHIVKNKGPIYLPFDDNEIKIYIDNLFTDGILTPVEYEIQEPKNDPWIMCGIKSSNSEPYNRRILKLLNLLNKNKLSIETRYEEWLAVAQRWAEISALIHRTNKSQYKNQYYEYGEIINELFSDWLKFNYANLFSISPTNPALLSQIPRFLARKIEENNDLKVAILVIDGLSLDQWVTIRSCIQKQSCNLVMRNSAIFAWIPTITSFSRQSIFSGKPPFLIPNLNKKNANEEILWKQFWEENGLSNFEVTYRHGLGLGEVEPVLDLCIDQFNTKVAGLVIDMVDKIMHGMQLGAEGMHGQIEQWCKGGYLTKLLNYLTNLGFEIWLTSDHGNKEAIGEGRPSEGVTAEIKGQRMRMYPTKELRARVATSYTFAREWDPIGLPKDCFPLVISGNQAFANRGELIVGHGGISLEEVIVPFVKIESSKENER